MTLPIYLLGQPVLRKQCEDITPEYPELKKLVADMFDTMYASEGVGLAAPQIGRADRIVVIDASTVLDGENISRSEGCLSLPGIAEDVKRIEHIRLQWLDEDFNEHDEEISGYLARIIQHECDHLEGKVFTDHLSAIRRQLIRGRLNNILSGRVSVDYPVRFAKPHRR
ncbi:MAG TPA: peptide deformylase [Muribaculaceae bacterium]|nr:peptide deformylase [Muribaculaceae bacterium]